MNTNVCLPFANIRNSKELISVKFKKGWGEEEIIILVCWICKLIIFQSHFYNSVCGLSNNCEVFHQIQYIFTGNIFFCKIWVCKNTFMSRWAMFLSWINSKASRICRRKPWTSSSKGTMSSSRTDWKSPPGALKKDPTHYQMWKSIWLLSQMYSGHQMAIMPKVKMSTMFGKNWE